MLRISVTSIEKFRRFMTEASPFDTEESLVESLKGIFVGNDKTRFGGAFHSLIEHGGSCTWINKAPGYLVDGIFFTKEQGDHALAYRRLHPQMVHEINVRKIYETKYFPIQVTGRVDSTEGMAIRDAKTKFRSPGNFKEYLDGCQWKFYLDMMETEVFYYDLFEVIGFQNLSAKPPHIIHPEVRIEPHEPMPCRAYGSMSNDLQVLLDEFLEYIHFRGYLELLKPAIEETVLL